ncbi:MAG: DUF456 domain-containing protein [Gemmatimonadota bacterium]
MALALLIVAAFAGLFLVALGLPGLWLFLLAVVGFKLLVATPLSWTVIGVVAALAVFAEVIEWTISVRFTKKYGGSSRAGWGALLGGLVGAVVGVPIPIVGSMIGSFLGSFLGAFLGEYSAERRNDVAHRAAWGALIGRTVATGAKIAIGFAMAVLVVFFSLGT